MFVTDEQVSACVFGPQADAALRTTKGDTFLRKYIEYGMERTDAPAIFHLATGLAMISATCRKEFALGQTFGAETYPNLYVMILGPSASRKTHSASLGYDKVFAAALPNRIGNLPGSYEGLLESLAERPSQCIFDPEMSRFYRQSSSMGGHLGPLKQGLTDVYDCKKISRQTRKVRIQPQDTHRLSLIGCIALDEFEANVEATDITGGFISRFLLAVGNRTYLRPLTQNPTYKHQPTTLAAHLRWISAACPANLASMSPEATEYSNELVRSWDTVDKGLELKTWASIWERASAMARKIALLLALDRYALELSIPTEQTMDGFIVPASNINPETFPPVVISLEEARKGGEIAKLFVDPAVHLVERLPTSRQAREIQAVRRAVEATSREAQRNGVPGATFGAISRSAGTNKKTTQHMLETLMEQGVIMAHASDRGQQLYVIRPVRDGVDPSWELFPGGFDPENPPQLLSNAPLPPNVVPFQGVASPAPRSAAPPERHTESLSYEEACKRGLIVD